MTFSPYSWVKLPFCCGFWGIWADPGSHQQTCQVRSLETEMFDFHPLLSHSAGEMWTDRGSTLSLLSLRQLNLILVLMAAIFQSVPAGLRGLNNMHLKISSGECHNTFINRGRIFLNLFASKAITVKPLFITSAIQWDMLAIMWYIKLAMNFISRTEIIFEYKDKGHWLTHKSNRWSPKGQNKSRNNPKYMRIIMRKRTSCISGTKEAV